MSISQEIIIHKIYMIRGKKVMLDRDLAKLYGVETKYLKRQIRRNRERFPSDFMFELNKKELENWRCQFVTSKSTEKMGLRYPPYAFTDYGILMLSSVLKSDKAVQVNIQIMRAFVRMREMAFNFKELAKKVEAMERRYDKQFAAVFEAIRELIKQERRSHKKIGFHKA